MNDQGNDFIRGLRARSRDCPYCEGQGLAVVYSPTYRGHPLERVRPASGPTTLGHLVPAMVNASCLCPLGRWMRTRLKPEDLARTPDYADVLAGRSRWRARDPREEA